MKSKMKKLKIQKPVAGYRRPDSEESLTRYLQDHLISARAGQHLPSSCGLHGYVFRVGVGVISKAEYSPQKIEGMLDLAQRFVDASVAAITTYEEHTAAGSKARRLLSEIMLFLAPEQEQQEQEGEQQGDQGEQGQKCTSCDPACGCCPVADPSDAVAPDAPEIEKTEESDPPEQDQIS